MTSFTTETLFNSRSNTNLHQPPWRAAEVPSYPKTHYRHFQSLIPQQAEANMEKTAGANNFHIHTGPTPPRSQPMLSRNGILGDYPSLGFIPSAFVKATDGSDAGARALLQSTNRELIRCKVVNERDAHRGFRLFDGLLMSVKDVSSEELFLERMRIVYSIYDAHVAAYVNRSPLEVAKALVRAVSACLTTYFTTQSMLRTNRPFIAKVLHLDSADMFCKYSDFIQSFMFTNASAEDDVIISLAEKVYAENVFDVCNDHQFSSENNNIGGANPPVNTTTDQLFDFVTRIAERKIVGGSQPSFAVRHDNWSTPTLEPTGYQSEYAKTSVTSNTDENTTAMLIVVTDFEALHNYVAYVMYMTPANLSRRYNLNLDCLRRPNGTVNDANNDCCRQRDSRRRKRDTAKAAIRSVIERRRREKIDSMKERGVQCDSVLQQRAVQMTERNNDLLCHVLLMLFDKCISSLLDRGFENLNARRGYAVNSAKEIGTATIYTGIIDTVGEVSTLLEGCTFDGLVSSSSRTGDSADNVTSDENRQKQHRLHFSLPIDSIVSGTTDDSGNNAVDSNTNYNNINN